MQIVSKGRRQFAGDFKSCFLGKIFPNFFLLSAEIARQVLKVKGQVYKYRNILVTFAVLIFV